MFHSCKLVHADLSEYNILYHEGHLCIIDVSQSVEHDHPSAFDFLRNDIKNVEEFFGRLGVRCLGLRRCFEFVTRDQVSEMENEVDTFTRWLDGNVELEQVHKADTTEVDSALSQLSISPSNPEHHAGRIEIKGQDAAHEDSVFLHSFIPRNLTDVYDPERDVEKLKRGDDLIYANTIGLVYGSARQKEKNGVERVDGTGAEKSLPTESKDLPDKGESTSESGDEDEGESDETVFIDKQLRGHRHEDKEIKKVCPL